jgi:RNA polymerase sigma-70 factor (ECF subfamily)
VTIDPVQRTASSRPAERERQFDALIGPLAEPAYRLALVILRDPAEAEDAVQEAALRAWRKLEQLKDEGAARPWFLAIVANQCRAARRRRWWSIVRMADPPVESAAVEQELVDAADLRRAMTRLTDDERLALYLHYSEDLPLEQAAAVMGLSASAAKSRVYRALKRLRPGLELREARR